METMHSKLIRLQTALLTLALLFTVLIPVSAYAEGETTAAQGTANSETISDPNTFNAWEYTQAYNNATTGRIWADKTVEEKQIDLKGQDPIAVPKDKGADFLVALSALSSPCVYYYHRYKAAGCSAGAGCLRQYGRSHGEWRPHKAH